MHADVDEDWAEVVLGSGTVVNPEHNADLSSVHARLDRFDWENVPSVEHARRAQVSPSMPHLSPLLPSTFLLLDGLSVCCTHLCLRLQREVEALQASAKARQDAKGRRVKQFHKQVRRRVNKKEAKKKKRLRNSSSIGANFFLVLMNDFVSSHLQSGFR